jgi:hypothetical protein
VTYDKQTRANCMPLPFIACHVQKESYDRATTSYIFF